MVIETGFIVFLVFAVVFVAMAVGVMLGRKPISGSCKNALGDCDICGAPSGGCNKANG